VARILRIADEQAKALSAQRGALVALADAAIAGARLGPGELSDQLGVKSLRALGGRRGADVRFKVIAARAATALLTRIARPNHARVLSVLAMRLWVRSGRSVTARALSRWAHTLAREGAAALVDRRGRPRGHRAVDRELAISFVDLLAQGATLTAAQAAMLARAEAEGRTWPRALRTVRELLREAQVRITDPAPLTSGQREYLDQTGLERN
jgi:hypothetical protein